jgi:hypothetical protein
VDVTGLPLKRSATCSVTGAEIFEKVLLVFQTQLFIKHGRAIK